MWNVSSYRYDEFIFDFEGVDRSEMPGIEYRIDRLRAVPLVAYIVLFIVGVFGNVWVTCVIGCIIGKSSTRAPRSVQIYILALCCCDLVVLVFSLALIVDLWSGEWLIESKFLCLLYLSSESLNKFCSPFLLVALSYFCYTKICRPTSNLGSLSKGQRQFFDGDVRTTSVIASACVILSFVALTPVYMYGDLHFIVYENHSRVVGIVTKCAFEPSEPDVLTIFTIYAFALGYGAPTLMFTCFHAAIVMRVRRQQAIRSSTRRTSTTFLRVTRTIAALVIFYIACWTPYWCLVVWSALTPLEGQGELSDSGVVANYFVHMLPYVNCTGYPILYTMMNRDIQDAYSRVKAKREAASRASSASLRYGSPAHWRRTTGSSRDNISEEATML